MKSKLNFLMILLSLTIFLPGCSTIPEEKLSENFRQKTALSYNNEVTGESQESNSIQKSGRFTFKERKC